MGYFGTNNLIEKISPDFGKLFSQLHINKWFIEHLDTVVIVGSTILLVVLTFLTIKVMYAVVNIDNIHKDTQRLFVLKRLNDIWEYTENTDVEELEVALQRNEDNVVFTKIKFSTSKFDQEFRESVGDILNYHLFFLSKLRIFENLDFKKIRMWFYGLLPSTFIITLTVAISSFTSTIYYSTPDKTVLIYIVFICLCILLCVLPILYFVFYFSQLDRLENNTPVSISMTQARNYDYRIEKRVINKISTKATVLIQGAVVIGGIYVSNIILWPLDWKLLFSIPSIVSLLVVIAGYFFEVKKI